ncbi:MAG: hypothetical protein GXO50_09285 [Chlorobi bacterium]|nr:hypothetical protein [Chlorobiota bacterium]
MKKILLFLIILSTIFNACTKTFDCITGAGDDVEYTFALQDFDTLKVNDVFDIELIQDTVNELKVFAKQKYADNLTYSTADNILTLDNAGNCKFTKPESSKIKIKLRVKKISRIKLNAASCIFSDDTLYNPDEIGLIANSKFNDVRLKVNCRVFYYWNTHLNGGKTTVEGKSAYLKLWNVSLAAVDAGNLISDDVYVENDSKGDIYVFARKILNCTVTGTGNVYYKGNPSTIIVEDTVSSGKLIKID